jgi:peptidoglycan hydrolase-like protein with peptidoglycan-binding domain
MLAKAGYMSPQQVDGKMGPITTTAIKKFQSDHGVKPNGQMSQETWYALDSRANPATTKSDC